MNFVPNNLWIRYSVMTYWAFKCCRNWTLAA